MKLRILCLFVTFACVLAAPAPRPDGPMESVFKMLSGLPQSMISEANRMLGRIPVVNTIPRLMQGGMNIGESIAENMDYMMGAGGRRRKPRAAPTRQMSQENEHRPEQSGSSRQMGDTATPDYSNKPDSRQTPQRRSEGPMERLYKTFSGIPQAIVSGANQMLGGIPVLNLIPQMMQNGLNMADKAAINVDNMEKQFFQRGRQTGQSMMNRMSRPHDSRPSHKTDEKTPPPPPPKPSNDTEEKKNQALEQ